MSQVYRAHEGMGRFGKDGGRIGTNHNLYIISPHHYHCLSVCSTFSRKLLMGLGWNFTWTFIIIRHREVNKMGSNASMIMHKLSWSCAKFDFFDVLHLLLAPYFRSPPAYWYVKFYPLLCSLTLHRVVTFYPFLKGTKAGIKYLMKTYACNGELWPNIAVALITFFVNLDMCFFQYSS